MKAGTLRHRVTVQTPAIVQDTSGTTTQEWSDVGTYKAAVEPLNVREQFMVEQEQASATHRVRFRYRPELAAMTGKERVLFGSRVLVLVGLPTNIDERNREIEVLTEEGLRQE